ncbi:hypothetical protein ACR0IB_17905, partial [Acinetobacter baumannii]|uniref:hypothetical protein n=1 Tax=Acinetobacter baumannii TaxID=470 RepID=UPI003D98985D
NVPSKHANSESHKNKKTAQKIWAVFLFLWEHFLFLGEKRVSVHSLLLSEDDKSLLTQNSLICWM